MALNPGQFNNNTEYQAAVDKQNEENLAKKQQDDNAALSEEQRRKDTIIPNIKVSDGYNFNIKTSEVPYSGANSLMNGYAVFRYYTANGDKNKLFDVKGKDGIRGGSKSGYVRPTTEKLVYDWNDTVARQPYHWSDFLYCKFYGEIPNNQLITLRRFPGPVLDNLTFPQLDNNLDTVPYLSQAVTWFSKENGNSLSDILKFTTGIKWKTLTAEVQEVDYDVPGGDSSPLGSKATGLLGLSNDNNSDPTGQKNNATEAAKAAYGSDGKYWNRVYGPVNVISETLARDRGLEFTQDGLVIKFHYELKSIGSINPKMALLDIMSNMLALTFNNAQFWGGATRYFANLPESPFVGDYKKWYSGDFLGYFDSVEGEISNVLGAAGDFLEQLFSDPVAALKKLASGVGNTLMGKASRKGRPNHIAVKSLLTGVPVGEWHLCIGNPYNPTAMIGNLVVDSTDFEFSDTLGADDFPEDLTVTVTLKHGKPRDKGDIESMFNGGEGRLYYTPEGEEDILNSSSTTSNTKVTTADQNQATDKKDKKTNLKYGVFNGTESDFEQWQNRGTKAYNKVGGFSQDTYKGFKDAFKS